MLTLISFPVTYPSSGERITFVIITVVWVSVTMYLSSEKRQIGLR